MSSEDDNDKIVILTTEDILKAFNLDFAIEFASPDARKEANHGMPEFVPAPSAQIIDFQKYKDRK